MLELVDNTGGLDQLLTGWTDQGNPNPLIPQLLANPLLGLLG